MSNEGLLDTKEAEHGVRNILKLPPMFELTEVIKWAYNKAKTMLEADTSIGDNVVSKL